MTPAQRWGTALRAALAARDMRYTELARLIGLSGATVHNWSRDRSLPTPANAYRVAEELDAPELAELVDRLRTRKCPIDGRTFTDYGRNRHKTFCSQRCWNVDRYRKDRDSTVTQGHLAIRRLRLYMATVDQWCRDCPLGGLACQMPLCSIQVAGLSPLPVDITAAVA